MSVNSVLLGTWRPQVLEGYMFLGNVAQVGSASLLSTHVGRGHA